MQNDHIAELIIANNESKELHFGSGITGSCNLEKMGRESHSVEIAHSKAEVESAAKRFIARGFSVCGHCRHRMDLDPLIGIVRHV